MLGIPMVPNRLIDNGVTQAPRRRCNPALFVTATVPGRHRRLGK